MAAYMTLLRRFCDRCSSFATHEVRNTHNEVMGKCCAKHAKEWVDELNGEG
jgi:hypothetical protein